MGGQLLIASCAGTFFSLDRETGDVRWRHDITQHGSQQFHSQMLIVDDLVVIGTDNDRGYALALELETGDLRWKYDAGRAMGADVHLSNGVIVVTGKTEYDELVGLDPTTGKPLWTIQHGRVNDIGRFYNSPAVRDGVAYFGSTEGFVAAYDTSTGDALWSCSVDGHIITSLVADEHAVYGGTDTNTIFRIDRKLGTLDAQLDVGGRPINAPAILRGHCVVFLDWRSPESQIVVLDPALTRQVWTCPLDPENYGTIARARLHNGLLVLGTRHGSISGVTLEDGSLVWRRKVNHAVRSVGFHDGVMYVGTIPGPLYAMKEPQSDR